MDEQAGRILIFAGKGKGCTTAALGSALRAVGHGMKTLVIQFVKHRRCGEHEAAKRLAPELEIRLMGSGFLHPEDSESMEEARRSAGEALETARRVLRQGEHDMVILDEVLFAISSGLISAEEVLQAIEAREPRVHVILTGHSVPPKLAELADTVTEFSCVKHAFHQGTKATRGLEF